MARPAKWGPNTRIARNISGVVDCVTPEASSPAPRGIERRAYRLRSKRLDVRNPVVTDRGRGGCGDKRRRGDGSHDGSHAAHSGPFRVVEEEQLVFDNWSADGEPKLVSSEYGFRNIARVVVERVRSQIGNAIEFVCACVQVVSSRLGYNVDDPS